MVRLMRKSFPTLEIWSRMYLIDVSDGPLNYNLPLASRAGDENSQPRASKNTSSQIQLNGQQLDLGKSKEQLQLKKYTDPMRCCQI